MSTTSDEVGSKNPNRQLPKFLKLSQSILNWGNPTTLAEAVVLAEDLGKLDAITYGHSETPPTCTWATAVYAVGEDGRLTLLTHKLDSSD